MLASELMEELKKVLETGDAVVGLNVFGDYYYHISVKEVDTDRHGVKFVFLSAHSELE